MDINTLIRNAPPAEAEAIRRAMEVQTRAAPAAPAAPRRVVGAMNKTEGLFAAKLEAMKRAGAIRGWAFEAWTMVVIAAGGRRIRYTPDFLIWTTVAGGAGVTFAETKGGLIREDAALKFACAAERYPFCRFTMVQRVKHEWKVVRDINAEWGPAVM